MQNFVTTVLQLIQHTLLGALMGCAIGIWMVGIAPDRTATASDTTTSDQIAAIIETN